MGMTVERPAVLKGLEDVYVKESKICLVDGVKGRLLYVGYDIRDLAEHSSFEETCYLLWNARLPLQSELEMTRRAIGEERKVPKEVFDVLRRLSRTTVPIDALRTAVSALAAYDPELADQSRDANLRKALRVTPKAATLGAASARCTNVSAFAGLPILRSVLRACSFAPPWSGPLSVAIPATTVE